MSLVRELSLLSLLVVACSEPGRAPEAPRQVTLSRTLRIPVTTVPLRPSPEARAAEPERLLVRPGAEDELPHGPTGFDVLEDGGIVVTDPLRQRLLFVESSGAYRGQTELGFEASSVTLSSEGAMRLRSETTGNSFSLDSMGAEPRMLRAEEATRELAAEDRVELAGPNQATVETRAGGARRSMELDVRLDEEGRRLVSVRSLGSDAEGNTYVVLETTPGGPTVEISKRIWKYSPSGELSAEISDIELDYYVHPVDEFRVRDGVVYQLVPKENEILIRIWDTNP